MPYSGEHACGTIHNDSNSGCRPASPAAPPALRPRRRRGTPGGARRLPVAADEGQEIRQEDHWTTLARSISVIDQETGDVVVRHFRWLDRPDSESYMFCFYWTLGVMRTMPTEVYPVNFAERMTPGHISNIYEAVKRKANEWAAIEQDSRLSKDKRKAANFVKC